MSQGIGEAGPVSVAWKLAKKGGNVCRTSRTRFVLQTAKIGLDIISVYLEFDLMGKSNVRCRVGIQARIWAAEHHCPILLIIL